MLWLVLPTRNEEAMIESNLDRLLTFCRTAFSGEDWRVIVADNASTDTTRTIVQRVADRDPLVELMTFDRPGKGGAVLGAWRNAERRRGGAAQRPSEALREGGSPPAIARDGSTHVPATTNAGGSRGHKQQQLLAVAQAETGEAMSNPRDRRTPAPPLRHTDVFSFLDADLATDLRHLPELIATVRDGADIAAASRYLPGATVERSVFRTLVSRANRLLLRARFDLRMTDPPCGMKAVSERVVRDIVPLVRDTQWFFDTELCIRAQRAGLRIVELPVAWHEPRPTRGSLRKVFRITRANLRAMRRV